MRTNQTRQLTTGSTLIGAAAALVAAGLITRAAVRRARHMSLCDRTVLITGGSRGLGLELAREAVRLGANVAVCARDEAELLAAREELRRRGADVLAVQCDITSAAQVAGMVEGVIKHFGMIDVLINNAGVITVSPIDDVTTADFERAMQTHFSGPLYTTLAVLPSMRLRRRGRIVNIASIGGKVPVPHLVPYCASKYALVGLSESLRTELSRDGVYVTTVVPGLMRTGSPRNVDVRGQHEKEYAWFATADVLPLVSVSSRRAARRILKAACQGRAELIMPWSARLAATVHGLCPGLSMELAALGNRLLPDPGGFGTRAAKGAESDSPLVPAFARDRNREAAEANNELPQAVVD